MFPQDVKRAQNIVTCTVVMKKRLHDNRSLLNSRAGFFPSSATPVSIQRCAIYPVHVLVSILYYFAWVFLIPFLQLLRFLLHFFTPFSAFPVFSSLHVDLHVLVTFSSCYSFYLGDHIFLSFFPRSLLLWSPFPNLL